MSERSNWKYTAEAIAAWSPAWVLLRAAASRPAFESSASAWSLAFSRAAASAAARSAVDVVAGVADAETLWREQALLSAAIASRET